jgi:GH24 family phage-related lysozyme (muramidase)
MHNRFLAMNQHLANLQRDRRRGGDGGAGVRGSATAVASSRHGAPLARGRDVNRFARPFSAAQRALVILIENGGIDLGLGTIVDRLLDAIPLSSLIPDEVRQTMVREIDRKVREITDDALESLELGVNRYASSRPEHFGDVVILRNGTALYSELRDTLVRLSGEGKTIDLIILTHGGVDRIALVNGADVGSADIRAIRAHNGGAPVRLRSVYMMNCHAASLSDAWLEVGAKVVSGAARVNYLPEPTTFFFFRNWKSGKPFGEAVTNAYLATIAAMKGVIRAAADALPGLPAGLTGAIAERIADLEGREFVRDSRPEIKGDASVTIASDTLSFAASMSAARRAVAYTVVPVSRSFDDAAAGQRTQTWAVSDAGVEFIKSWEDFRDRMYNDAAGHCTIGYGTLLHRGNCNGNDASEAPFKDGVSQERALELLRSELNDAQRTINQVVKVEVTQSQFDALVSLAYNIGLDAFKKSTLLKKLNDRKFTEVPTEFKRWVKADGKTLRGLVRRRDAEAAMFSGGTYSNNQSVRFSRPYSGGGTPTWSRPFDVPRGIRNNNPGNLRISDQAWEGKVPRDQNTDGAFEQFTSFEYGARALVLLLHNYIRRGLNSVRKIVNAYAPSSDGNHTENYARFLVDRLRAGGVEVTADTTLTADRRTLRSLARGVARMENGQECLSDEQFDAGFAMLPDNVRNAIPDGGASQAQSRRRGGGNGNDRPAPSARESAPFYRGFGETAADGAADPETMDRDERVGAGQGALMLSTTIPAHCPIREADDARTEHFRLSEFASGDGVPTPRGVIGTIQILMEQLEVLRAEVGAPIRIHSGYRSPAHNASVGGAKKSQHLCGQAADITISGLTARQIYDRIESLIAAGRMMQGGLGLYDGPDRQTPFVHYDIRGSRARWTG